MMGRKSLGRELNPGLDLNNRSSRKRKRNLEDVGSERETQRVNRGESTSDQVEAGPSSSEQVEAGPSSSEQVEASPANTGQGLTAPSNTGQALAGPPGIGQGLTAPSNTGQGLTAPSNTGQGLTGPPGIGQGLTVPSNTGQGLTGPANTGQGAGGVFQQVAVYWDALLGRPSSATYGPIQRVPGIRLLPIGRPNNEEPWVGRRLGRIDNITPQHPGPIEVPSLVNTPGASPPEDRIAEGEGVPPGDSAADMDLF